MDQRFKLINQHRMFLPFHLLALQLRIPQRCHHSVLISQSKLVSPSLRRSRLVRMMNLKFKQRKVSASSSRMRRPNSSQKESRSVRPRQKLLKRLAKQPVKPKIRKPRQHVFREVYKR